MCQRVPRLGARTHWGRGARSVGWEAYVDRNERAHLTPAEQEREALAVQSETRGGPQSAEKVKQAFREALELPADLDIEALEIGGDPHWDSVGHMALVAELESRFEIMLETDDMIDMSSYAKALEILRRYGVDV